ncbi:hypothetical protein F4776DRAFT_628145 [Hypoxylon sp. NC0597]|nr:hypothetical protein F4776DRAFT_628145 [Hypoxylon sp. NC0597]
MMCTTGRTMGEAGVICRYRPLSLALLTYPSSTTKGSGSAPKTPGRIYPQRIIPWDNFDVCRKEI